MRYARTQSTFIDYAASEAGQLTVCVSYTDAKLPYICKYSTNPTHLTIFILFEPQDNALQVSRQRSIGVAHQVIPTKRFVQYKP